MSLFNVPKIVGQTTILACRASITMTYRMGKCAVFPLCAFIVFSLFSVVANGFNTSILFPVSLGSSQYQVIFVSNSTTIDALSDDLLDTVYDFSLEHSLYFNTRDELYVSLRKLMLQNVLENALKELNSDNGTGNDKFITEGILENILNSDTMKHDSLQYTDVPQLTIVTAFYDIGRKDWLKYPRSVDEYMQGFFPLLKLPGRYNIVQFLDDRYLDKVMNYVEEELQGEHEDISFPPLRIVPINFAWLEKDVGHGNNWR